MKKILLITHGQLCEGYKSAVRLICGLEEVLDTCILSEKETLETMMSKVEQYVQACQKDDLILIVTDIAVGTTTKCAIPMMMEGSCYVITGINLALLLELIMKEFQEDPYEQLLQLVEESKTTVMFMNDIMKKGSE